MASPGLQSFCCEFNSTDSYHRNILYQDGFLAYNILCLVPSSISILGALYQLWPKEPKTVPRNSKEVDSFLRQNTIICWLALADLCASFGILLRSALWLAGYIPLNEVQTTGTVDFAHLFCALSSGWIQYFYNCTYLWTFCYALDIYFLSKDKRSYMLIYHCLSWGMTALITAVGLSLLYYPALLWCDRTPAHLVPHSLCTYVPILFVMIVNPILYSKASTSVRLGLKSRGRYTDQERKIVHAVNKKFFHVILVFYVCWSPNILNGILLGFRKSLGDTVLLGLWQYMAVVNPVQAFLNTLVYFGSGGLFCHREKLEKMRKKRTHIQDSGSRSPNITDESTEQSSLLSR